MPLLTLQDVKDRLRITTTDQDDALEALRAAVEAWVLDLTGYVLTAETGVVEFHQNIRLGLQFKTRKRPVSAVTKVEGRTWGAGATSFTNLNGDLIDPTQGLVIAVGDDLSGFSGSEIPPRQGQALHFRWRERIWPVIKLTYDVSALSPIPADLRGGAIEMVAFLHSLPAAGALKSVTVEAISESYSDAQLQGSLPIATRAMLARHQRTHAQVVS